MPQFASASAYVHHERQSKLLCGVHALNSLLQHDYGRHFTQGDLDGICVLLDPPRCCHLNAHRHWAGLGDYDVNVLLYALGDRGLEGSWFDARQPASRLRPTLAEEPGVVGLLVNGAGGAGLFGGGNHWFAIRRVGGGWYDCNSLNRGPRAFVDVGELVNDLQRVLDYGGAIIVIRDAKAVAAAAEAAAATAAAAAAADAEAPSSAGGGGGAGGQQPAAAAATAAAAVAAAARRSVDVASPAGVAHHGGSPAAQHTPQQQGRGHSTASAGGSSSGGGGGGGGDSFSTTSPLASGGGPQHHGHHALAPLAPVFAPPPPPVPVPEASGRILTVRSAPVGAGGRPLSASSLGALPHSGSGPGRPTLGGGGGGSNFTAGSL